jgi:purine-binding chemotaxis protein CheW
MTTPAAEALRSEHMLTGDQYLTFELAGQHYGLDILCVQEIKGWERPTRLPHSPPYVQGVINLRGAVVPIIDLRCRFGLSETPQSRTTVVIVVRVEAAPRGELTAGLVVDAVCEVCSIETGQVHAPPGAEGGIDGQFVRGLALLEERMLVLLDVPRLIGATLGEPASLATGTRAA